MSLQFLLKQQGQTLSNGLFIAPCQTLSSYLLYELLQIFLVEPRLREFEYTRFALFGRIIEYDRIAVDMRLKHIQAVGRIRVRYDIEKSHCRAFGCWVNQQRHASKSSSPSLESHGYSLRWVYIQGKGVSEFYGCWIVFFADNDKCHCTIIVITYGFGDIGKIHVVSCFRACHSFDFRRFSFHIS